MTADLRDQQMGELLAHIQLIRGDLALDIDLTAHPGEIIAILGPNGAGKSTLLQLLAGLLVPDSGSVRLSGREVVGDDVFVPPERRRVGLMGQDPLLFPHLSAIDNIAFGPQSQGIPRGEARANAEAYLERMGLAGFGQRRPAQLSGGQRQRVALARALAAAPELLLLDEPLGALDAKVAPEIRQLLGRELRAAGKTTVLVTHDALDAATLADRIIVMADGVIVESGTTADVLASPRSSFAAAITGLNLISGQATAAGLAGEPVTVTSGAGDVTGIAQQSFVAKSVVSAVFDPAAVAVYAAPTGVGSPRNTWSATVVGLEPGVSAIRLRARCDTAAEGHVIPVLIAADVTAAAVAELGVDVGSRVFLSVKATEVRMHARG